MITYTGRMEDKNNCDLSNDEPCGAITFAGNQDM